MALEVKNNKKEGYIWLLVSSGLGLGLLPIAPGSFGALLGVGVHILLKLLFEAYAFYAIIFVLIVFFVISWYSLKWAKLRYRNHDPPNFVLDEVAGYMITALFSYNMNFYLSVAFSYIFFRLFDVIKIPPAYQIDQKMKGYLGVMLDDVVSAIYTVIVVKIIDIYI